jgi:preprotein translocase subunit YajC
MPTPPTSLFALAALLADGEAPADGAAQPVPFFMNPLFLIGMFGLFYVVVMLPARRREKRDAAAMFASMKAGSKVILTGGIVGTIVKVKDGEDEVVVRSEESKFRVLRSSVVRVIADDAAAETK